MVELDRFYWDPPTMHKPHSMFRKKGTVTMNLLSWYIYCRIQPIQCTLGEWGPWILMTKIAISRFSSKPFPFNSWKWKKNGIKSSHCNWFDSIHRELNRWRLRWRQKLFLKPSLQFFQHSLGQLFIRFIRVTPKILVSLSSVYYCLCGKMVNNQTSVEQFLEKLWIFSKVWFFQIDCYISFQKQIDVSIINYY